VALLNDLASARNALGLNTDLLRSRVGFHLAYARNLELARSGSAPSAAWARIASPQEPWRIHAMVASSYRSAAQYAALVDTRLATRLTLRAARAYIDAGVTFGLFLAAGVLSDQAMLRSGGDEDLRILSSQESADQEGPASHPVQQAYLLLTVAARPTLRQFYDGESPGALLERLSAYALQPIGPQSVPLATYLDIARLLLEDTGASSLTAPATLPATGQIASQLAAVGRAQATAVRANRRNHYLWQNGIAPVNVVDLEQVALFELAAGPDPRRAGQVLAQVTRLLENDEIAQLPSLAAAETAEVRQELADEATDIFRRRPGEEPPQDFRSRFGDNR
jgi:hypothetical protein